jgi:hypothetical protein
MAKKTSVKITGVDNLAKGFEKTIKMIESDKALFKEMGDYTVRNIVGSARLGKDPGGTQFKDLSDGWNKRRKRLATVNATDEFYREYSKKSRLIFTGQLLKSFTFSVSKLSLSFFFKGNRKPYKGIRKSALEGPATNAELAESIEETRPFVFLSEKMKVTLTSMVIKSLRKSLNNYKKLRRLLG